MANSIEQQLASLPSLDMAALRDLWRQLFETETIPSIRKSLMIRFLAYRIQEQARGGLSKRSEERLHRLASTLAADPKAELGSAPQIRAGTRLVRQWRDQVHVVNVEEHTFEYRGTRYESLSEIARLITGTRWSGPLFFGLKQQKQHQDTNS
jgi:K+-sensing histidine kinase KdpD